MAGRTVFNESESDARIRYERLFSGLDVPVNAADPAGLILFPKMAAAEDTPEITTACWNILGVSPSDIMCARSRMVVKLAGKTAPTVVAYPLIPYDPRFELGHTLAKTSPVSVNHPHCSRFCVLGSGTCSTA